MVVVAGLASEVYTEMASTLRAILKLATDQHIVRSRRTGSCLHCVSECAAAGSVGSAGEPCPAVICSGVCEKKQSRRLHVAKTDARQA